MTNRVENLRQYAEDKLRLPRELHEYQWDGVAFLYGSRAALLADEMGLGKTVQAVVALSLSLIYGRDPGRVLIVAPASVVPNWIHELHTWAPTVTVDHLRGTKFDREAFYLLPIPVLVASYEQIAQDSIDLIPSDTFDLVVLDEAQRIKNMHSRTALACQVLPRRRAWALSATPLENNASDVRSILRFLEPMASIPQSPEQLSDRLRQLMLRRRKSDVRQELPPVILQDLRVRLSALQRTAYDDLWAERLAVIRSQAIESDPSVALLGFITRLKVLCNYHKESSTSAKLEALDIFLQGAGHEARILVFSQFVDTLKWLSRRVSIPHDFIVGSMPVAARQAAMDSFNQGTTPRVLFVSLRAGGVGLNLGRASHVVIFDRWWNPAVEVQAIYRAHRFERADPLHVVRFLVENSVEEHIQTVLERKDALFERVIESVDGFEVRLSRDDLLHILAIPHAELNSGRRD